MNETIEHSTSVFLSNLYDNMHFFYTKLISTLVENKILNYKRYSLKIFIIWDVKMFSFLPARKY